MRKNYDFSKGTKNPYAKRLKKQITIRLESDVIHYFKALSSETGNFRIKIWINLYLRDCAVESRRLSLKFWKAPKKA